VISACRELQLVHSRMHQRFAGLIQHTELPHLRRALIRIA
jgi:hypothetical protein